MLKKIVITMFCIITIVGSTYSLHHYTERNCTVVRTSGHSVLIQDPQGDMWKYIAGKNIPRVGSKVNVRFHNNYTDDNLEDDRIVKVVER
jgi:hypothetical protein